MQEVVVNLKEFFAMSDKYLAKYLKEKCFDVVNAYLKYELKIKHDVFYISADTGQATYGYTPYAKNKETAYFSTQTMPADFSAIDRATAMQFCIFEGFKHHGLYEKVPMCGAPERGLEAYFTFEWKGGKYKFILW